MTMQVVSHIKLGSAAANITFSSIPQTYTDLLLLTSLRDTTANAGWAYAYIYPNGSSANMSSRFLYGFSTTVGAATDTALYHQLVRGASTANTFSNSSVYIANFTSSSHKSFSVDTSTERNDAASINAITAGLWSNTAPITSCSSGEVTYVPLTQEELEERELMAAQAEQERLEREAAEAKLQADREAGIATLKGLGLTDDQITALLK